VYQPCQLLQQYWNNHNGDAPCRDYATAIQQLSLKSSIEIKAGKAAPIME
jgi:hypothetical protein